MAGILSTTQPLNERFTLPASNSPGNVDVLVVDSSLLPSGPVAPFRAQYYVDPAFAGVQTGSASNPFTTIAAAFARAALLAQAAGIVYVPANAAIAENVVLPNGAWELSVIQTRTAQIAPTAVINGTIALGTGQPALTGLNVTGAVTGNATASTRAICTRCSFISTFTYNISAGNLRVIFTSDGPGLTGVNGFNVGACTIAGSVVARGWRWLGLLTIALDSELNTCILDVGVTATAALNLRLVDVLPGSVGVAFTALGGAFTVTAAPATVSSFLATSPTLVGGARLIPAVGNLSLRTLAAGNIPMASLVVTNPYPDCQAICEASLQLLVPGTAGAAVLNAGYRDLLGVFQTKPVTPALNIAGAAGSDVQGSYVFQKNAGTPMQFSVTGIVTPGALSYSVAVNFRVAN